MNLRPLGAFEGSPDVYRSAWKTLESLGFTRVFLA